VPSHLHHILFFVDLSEITHKSYKNNNNNNNAYRSTASHKPAASRHTRDAGAATSAGQCADIPEHLRCGIVKYSKMFANNNQ
jgi:hypothetical protein